MTEDDDDWPAEENQRSAALDNSDDEQHVDRQVQEGNLCCRQPEQHRQHAAEKVRDESIEERPVEKHRC